MPHSVKLGIIGANEITFSALEKITSENIIPSKNIYITSKHKEKLEKAAKYGVNICETDDSMLMRAEIIIIGTSKNNLQTVLAPICAMTRGKLIISLVNDVDVEYIVSRAAKGTHIIAANWEIIDNKFVINAEKSSAVPKHLEEIFSDIFCNL